MLKAILANYASASSREFAHGRQNTVGASEIGSCLRKTWFSKNDTPHDNDYVDRYGARLRGTLIEDNFWVPALRAAFGNNFHLNGDEQTTVVDGYLSATPDGVITNLPRNCLSYLGVDDIGPSNCLAVECKSIDPRANLHERARPQHSFQTQVQMGLLRAHTQFKPDYALISYIDASFLDEVTEFVVEFHPEIYDAAQQRSVQIMSATNALDLPPEGKISGGAECSYCPWASHCKAVIVAGIPKSDDKPLGDNAMAEFHALRDRERAADSEVTTAETALAVIRQEIKDLLRANGVRRVHGDNWSIDWTPVKGRQTLDLKAIEADGLDLSHYRKTGEPGERLSVK